MTESYVEPMVPQGTPPQEPPKKKLYQKTWFIILLLIFFWPAGIFLMWAFADWKKVVKIIISVLFGIILIAGFVGGGDDTSTEADSSSTSTEVVEETQPTTKDPTADYTTEEMNCYRSALSYLDYSGFSKQGLIDQLSSEYADNYPVEVAEKIVNDIEEQGLVDWVEEAKESAQAYLDYTSFSRDGLIDQLCSSYADKYTREEAEAAVDAVYK